MRLTLILPALTAVLAAVFAVGVLRRWYPSRRPYLLLWAIGISAFGIGAVSEAAFALFGWNGLVFRLYYYCGAMIAAAWLGQGTVQLLVRRPWPQVSLVVLLLLSLYGIYELGRAKLEPAFMSRRIGEVNAVGSMLPEEILQRAGTTVATPRGALMDAWARALAARGDIDYRAITVAPERVPFGQRKGNVAVGTAGMLGALGLEAPGRDGLAGTPIYVVEDEEIHGRIMMLPAVEMNGSAIVGGTSAARSLTPIFNIYGTLGLAGGAVYSAWLFLRKRTLYNRMLGNVLIACGALAPALGGTFSKAGLPYAVQISNLLGIVVIYTGFLRATRTDTPSPIVSNGVHAPRRHGVTET